MERGLVGTWMGIKDNYRTLRYGLKRDLLCQSGIFQGAIILTFFDRRTEANKIPRGGYEFVSPYNYSSR